VRSKPLAEQLVRHRGYMMHDKLHTSSQRGQAWLLGSRPRQSYRPRTERSSSQWLLYTPETTDSPVGRTTNLSELVTYKLPPWDVVLSVAQLE
jgi:hypothetical protein